MKRAVSIVLPALDTPDLLAANLPALLAELAARAAGDEIIVVDDTGQDRLEAWLGKRFPEVRTVARTQNGGFAQALKSGVEASKNELVFSMNTDVRVRPGFLEPLIDVLEDPEVMAVSPRVLLDGDEESFESNTVLGMKQGLLCLERSQESGCEMPEGVRSVPFAVGGTVLFRRSEFLDRGGFDPLYEPFYLEDVDWCWEAWSLGRRVVVQPDSVVEHNHRGTIGDLVDPDVVRAAIERNRMLFLWKHLDDEDLLEEHLTALAGRATNAWLTEEREPLIWLLLALEERRAAIQSRKSRPLDKSGSRRDFRAILDQLDSSC